MVYVWRMKCRSLRSPSIYVGVLMIHLRLLVDISLAQTGC